MTDSEVDNWKNFFLHSAINFFSSLLLSAWKAFLSTLIAFSVFKFGENLFLRVNKRQGIWIKLAKIFRKKKKIKRINVVKELFVVFLLMNWMNSHFRRSRVVTAFYLWFVLMFFHVRKIIIAILVMIYGLKCVIKFPGMLFVDCELNY